MAVRFINVPRHYYDLLGPLPSGLTVCSTQSELADFIHYFTDEREQLEAQFPALKQSLKKEGMLWISWPKRSSGVPTDLNENIVREIGLENGLVDVKVAAVDEVWSGLKFVYRVQDRG